MANINILPEKKLHAGDTFSIHLFYSPGIAHILVSDKQNTCKAYKIWLPYESDLWGNIYMGRVTTYMPSLHGYFIDIGEKNSGFLSVSDKSSPLQEGDLVTVKVTRSAQGNKGLRLSLADQKPPAMKPSTPALLTKGPSPLEEIAQLFPDAPIYTDSLSILSHIPSHLKSRVSIQPSISSSLLDEISSFTESSIALDNGMVIHFSPTPALTAIDMDSASASFSYQNKHYAQFGLNKEALPFVFDQIRFRNYAGAILIDMAGLPSRKRPAMSKFITDQLERDPVKPKLLGFTHLGLAEIIRPYQRPPLQEIYQSLPAIAALFLKELVAYIKNKNPFQNTAHITYKADCGLELAHYLTGIPALADEFFHMYGITLTFTSAPFLAPRQWRIT